jgi:hypothetical protein
LSAFEYSRNKDYLIKDKISRIKAFSILPEQVSFLIRQGEAVKLSG